MDAPICFIRVNLKKDRPQTLPLDLLIRKPNFIELNPFDGLVVQFVRKTGSFTMGGKTGSCVYFILN